MLLRCRAPGVCNVPSFQNRNVNLLFAFHSFAQDIWAVRQNVFWFWEQTPENDMTQTNVTRPRRTCMGIVTETSLGFSKLTLGTTTVLAG
jgi:hypothetical protein